MECRNCNSECLENIYSDCVTINTTELSCLSSTNLKNLVKEIDNKLLPICNGIGDLNVSVNFGNLQTNCEPVQLNYSVTEFNQDYVFNFNLGLNLATIQVSSENSIIFYSASQIFQVNKLTVLEDGITITITFFDSNNNQYQKILNFNSSNTIIGNYTTDVNCTQSGIITTTISNALQIIINELNKLKQCTNC